MNSKIWLPSRGNPTGITCPPGFQEKMSASNRKGKRSRRAERSTIIYLSVIDFNSVNHHIGISFLATGCYAGHSKANFPELSRNTHDSISGYITAVVLASSSFIAALANRAVPRAKRIQPGSSMFTHGSHKNPPATATTISTSWGYR